MHRHGGYCFVDYAASAPYVDIDMHPADPLEKLDAVYFSPHKFLGGPGSPGVLIFDSRLYHNRVPDQPGGGTVNWTNPWKQHSFVDGIEAREDGGTPGFLQTIKAALAVQLKEAMGTSRIQEREHELLELLLRELRTIPRLHILADHLEDRLAIVSFYVEDLHYNLLVRLLNDRFGIQVRGGCSCAGTYGHYLLHVDPNRSSHITEKIDQGDLSEKPGWVRMSLHPTTTRAEVEALAEAVRACVKNAGTWGADYRYSSRTNEFTHVRGDAGRSGPRAALPDLDVGVTQGPDASRVRRRRRSAGARRPRARAPQARPRRDPCRADARAALAGARPGGRRSPGPGACPPDIFAYAGRSFGGRVLAAWRWRRRRGRWCSSASPSARRRAGVAEDERVLEALTCPTLVVQGAADPLGPVRTLERLAARNARLELTVLAGATHSFGRRERLRWTPRRAGSRPG